MVVQVRLFAGLRERAGWSERELDVAEGPAWPTSGRCSSLGESAGGLLYAVNQEYAERRPATRRRRRGRADPAGLRRRLPRSPTCRSTRAPWSRRRPTTEAGAIATFLGTTRVESRGRTVHYLDYEAYGGMAEKVMARARRRAEGEARALRGRDHPPRRPGRDRRDLGRDRRLGPAPRGGAGRLRRGDRHAQGDRAALEEGGLRGRRGVDRAGFLSRPPAATIDVWSAWRTPAGARTSSPPAA